MENKDNAHCTICGQGYHLCQTCTDMKVFTPWKSVTDTFAHYLIYMAIHGYTVNHDKDKAKEALSECDLSDVDKFNQEIKGVIIEIMSDDLDDVTLIANPKPKKRVVK